MTHTSEQTYGTEAAASIDLHDGGAARPEVFIDHLYKSFGRNLVLRGVNLTIGRGELVAIVGASGSGKSVLLKHMIGIHRPDEGRVWMADHETDGSPLVDLSTLNELAMDRLRRHWAAVFQKNALFSGSVFDNISLGLSDVKGLDDQAIEARAREVLDAVGLDFEQVARMNRDEISGGMAKRVAIARALALDPVLIMYDEPTSGLDPARSRQIQDLIADAHGRKTDSVQRTTIVVTHDTGLLYHLKPRIVMLDEGHVHFDGSIESFGTSSSPVVRPYLESMPSLHLRTKL